MLIIVFGLPGSGKSFFAARLAEKINAVYISSDRLRLTMFPVRNYSAEEKELVYHEMLTRAKEYISGKSNVVLDATFYLASLRKKVVDEFSKIASVFFIEVTASETVISNRLSKPRVDSEANYVVYQQIKARWEPLEEDHLVLESADDNIDDMLEKAIHYLDDKK